MGWIVNRLVGLSRTQESLSESDTARVEKVLVADGMCVMAMVTLQGGVFLTAFALALGASNYEIGLLTTIVFASQFMQVAGLGLLKWWPKRRAWVVILCGLSRLQWVFIILIPILFLSRGVTFLLQWLLIAALVGAMAGPAWNSLMRDIVPEKVRGRFFARRLTWGTGLALVCTLLGGAAIDWWAKVFPEWTQYGYSGLFTVGLLFGLASLCAVARLPETPMVQRHDESVAGQLLMPLKDKNFRNLLWFIAIWSFAVNMAAPFFTVYMLKRIGLPIFLVTLFVVLSQLSNIAFLNIWGRLADRFSNKPVLGLSGFLFLLGVLAWSFTTLPERHALTLPILAAIHILSGMSVAGVSIASGNIALKLSPAGNAHGYMTVFGLAASATGAFAPIVGGALADFFSQRQLSLTLNWTSPGEQLQMYAVDLKALDFVFALAFLIGLYSLHRLGRVTEEGEATGQAVAEELLAEMAMPLRAVSSVAGIRRLAYLPLAALRRGASMLM